MTDLSWRNRRIIARRTGWPAGALAECERLDVEHPGWTVCWLPVNRRPGWERSAGFAAHLLAGWLVGSNELRREPEDGVPRMPWVFGPDVVTLERKIAAVNARITGDEADRERPQGGDAAGAALAGAGRAADRASRGVATGSPPSSDGEQPNAD